MKLYEVNYFCAYKEADETIQNKGEIWKIGVFSSAENAINAIKKDSDDERLTLIPYDDENGDISENSDFHLYEDGELIGYYEISSFDLDEIVNFQICE